MKKFIKFIACLSVLAMCISMLDFSGIAFADKNAKDPVILIQMPMIEARPGEYITFNVIIAKSNIEDTYYNTSMEIYYEKPICLERVEAGDAIKSLSTQIEYNPDRNSVLLKTEGDFNLKDGDIIYTMRFWVPDEMVDGYYPICFKSISFTDNNGNEVPSVAVDGSIIVRCPVTTTTYYPTTTYMPTTTTTTTTETAYYYTTTTPVFTTDYYTTTTYYTTSVPKPSSWTTTYATADMTFTTSTRKNTTTTTIYPIGTGETTTTTYFTEPSMWTTASVTIDYNYPTRTTTRNTYTDTPTTTYYTTTTTTEKPVQTTTTTTTTAPIVIGTGYENWTMFEDTIISIDDDKVTFAERGKTAVMNNGYNMEKIKNAGVGSKVSVEAIVSPSGSILNIISIDVLEKPVTFGDANGDNEINVADAVLIMQSLSNPNEYKLTEQQKANADVVNHGDGVTAMDALAIQLIGLNMVKAEDFPITTEQLSEITKN